MVRGHGSQNWTRLPSSSLPCLCGPKIVQNPAHSARGLAQCRPATQLPFLQCGGVGGGERGGKGDGKRGEEAEISTQAQADPLAGGKGQLIFSGKLVLFHQCLRLHAHVACCPQVPSPLFAMRPCFCSSSQGPQVADVLFLQCGLQNLI